MTSTNSELVVAGVDQTGRVAAVAGASGGPSGLPPHVIERILDNLASGRGEKVISCIDAAARLIGLGGGGSGVPRLGESVAYNLREALSAVSAAPPVEGGMSAVKAAWVRFQLARTDGDPAEALQEFTGEIERLTDDSKRQDRSTRGLIAFLQGRSGIDPISSGHDPVAVFGALLRRANRHLHGRASLEEAAQLYDEVVAWFDVVFAPPDNRVEQVAGLAVQPFSLAGLAELHRLALDAHHLQVFFSHLSDQTWLAPLRKDGLVSVPRPGEPWPFGAVASVGLLSGEDIVNVLQGLLQDVRRLPQEERAFPSAEIMRVAVKAGPVGYPIAVEVVRRHPSDSWIEAMALSIVQEADPSDPVQVSIAKAVLGTESRHHGAHSTETVVHRLLDGMTCENAGSRLRVVAAKVRHLTAEESGHLHSFDIAALDADGHDFPDPIDVLASRLVAMVERSRSLRVSTVDVLDAVSGIDGELGERLISRVLTDADDVDRQAKVEHVARRLTSSRATGDDKLLIEDVLQSPLSAPEAAKWHAALGPPPTGGAAESEVPPPEWSRAWRWSAVLPDNVLVGWEQAIDSCNRAYGPMSAEALERRTDRFSFASGSSPISSETLSSLPVLDAAAGIATWRPSDEDAWGVSARELARSLESAVKEAPRDWATAASEIVMALREPVYIDHYFRGLAAKASDIGDLAPEIMAAVRTARSERWTPTVLGANDGYDYEPDWSGVEVSSCELIAALANANADLRDDLGYGWELAEHLFASRPASLGAHDLDIGPDELDDPLNSAINSDHGRALETLLAIGGWRFRNSPSKQSGLEPILDQVMRADDAVGLQLRAIVAARRPFVEAVAGTWLEQNADVVFATPPLGPVTFDLTLKWARPTRWILDNERDQLFDRAASGTERAATHLLVGHLWAVPGYDTPVLLERLRGNSLGLQAVGSGMAALVQSADEDDPALAAGLDFWDQLVDADPSVVPDDALTTLGRWAFSKAVSQDRWLDLMARTLERTGGQTDMEIEIAQRCVAAQPSTTALRILLLLLPQGEPWERHYVGEQGVLALRSAGACGTSREFARLRQALIERGHTDAASIRPDGQPPGI